MRRLLRGSGSVLAIIPAIVVGLSVEALRAQPVPDGERAAEWIDRLRLHAPTASTDGVCPPASGPLPVFLVEPAAAGHQMVRVSLPFAPGVFPAELSLRVWGGDMAIEPDVRVLTHHPGRPACVRRAIVTFPCEFEDLAPREFGVELAPAREPTASGGLSPGPFEGTIGSTTVRLTADGVEIRREGGPSWRATLLAPKRSWSIEPTTEIIERGRDYLWVRLFVPDADWPRILEVRADSLGTVSVRGHVQRLAAGGDRPRAPDLGWSIVGPALTMQATSTSPEGAPGIGTHQFAEGVPARCEGEPDSIDFPDAHLHQRGTVTVQPEGNTTSVTYWRCRAEEQVPHQHAAWRTATFVLQPGDAASWTALLEPGHRVDVPAGLFDVVYRCGVPPELSPWPELAAAYEFHLDAIAGCLTPGDDYGNVTSMPDGGAFGMNRLNHGPAIFEAWYRTGDARLREVALQWCANIYDSSIWWGTGRPGEFGGTRYNNMAAHNEAYRDDRSFMWRSDSAVSFCTKGCDSFFDAYEETGDPRMATALHWQCEYTREKVHADTGECRNIGDVADFMRLYRFTGDARHIEAAARLFRELRTKLSPGDLFSQGGQPIVAESPFIDNDKDGYQHPFAKPYIIGYALTGLPWLAELMPDEPKLRDVIRAVADFQAGAQDPVGGWRYPHPRSSGVSVAQSIEHAVQLTRAARLLASRGESIENLVDAIERVLQARVLAWERTGRFFGGLGGWESAAGVLKEGQTLQDLYRRPEDRDPSRDYSEGAISIGGAPPEGVVHFFEVLSFYLSRRPAERLFNANAELKQVLDRRPRAADQPPLTEPSGEYLRFGFEDQLPTFRDTLIARLTFPQAYQPEDDVDFDAWREWARRRLLESLLAAPPRVAFRPVVVAREDRGNYEARKLVFNVSADCRIPAYLLVPKGPGPFPAVVALHDHGAAFLIGKEKMVRPFDERQEIIDFANDWTRNYGGRFVGDELAKRGYVVFAADALFWGDRGRREGVEYESQQAVSSNLLQMGMTWVGAITWDDIRSAELVASLPEVDPSRIAAVGLSMGCHRTWMLCAATDRIVAGIGVCWLGTSDTLMAPGNNQVKGHSAYSMLIPDVTNYLDYPDIVSIACPKPMLLYNGEKDGLFPVPGVEAAYEKMRVVWERQDVGDRLVTKLWPVPHEFNVQMQDEAFEWLDRQMGVGPESRPASDQ